MGLDGRWLKVNQALCDITGYTAGELYARRLQDITHPDDVAGDLEIMRGLLAGEAQMYQREKRYINKNGHIVWILLGCCARQGR